MNSSKQFRIGTRGSLLALAQAQEVKSLLIKSFPELAGKVEIVIINTTGDMIQDRNLAEIGGKGLFTKEIDDATLKGKIDIAVHSMKDVPTWLPDGISLPCMLERKDVRDVFISKKAKSIADLSEGSTIGTASLRRQALILNRRPDLKVVNFRGNVQTRLMKLETGEVDATLLALAGLIRIGKVEVATSIIETDEILPAVAQGAIGVTCRSVDESSFHYLTALTHDETVIRVNAERAMLKVLDGSCRTPIAALGKISGDHFFSIRGLVARPDGSEVIETTRRGSIKDAEYLGREAGEELKKRAGHNFFNSLD